MDSVQAVPDDSVVNLPIRQAGRAKLAAGDRAALSTGDLRYDRIRVENLNSP